MRTDRLGFAGREASSAPVASRIAQLRRAMRGKSECAVRDVVNILPIDKGSCGRRSRQGRSAKPLQTHGLLRSSCRRLPGACPACCAPPPSAVRNTRHARCRPSQARERPSPARSARERRRPLRRAGRCAWPRSNDRTRHRESSGGDIRQPPLCDVRPSARAQVATARTRGLRPAIRSWRQASGSDSQAGRAAAAAHGWNTPTRTSRRG